MRIVTVTLNPALDKTASLDELRVGGLNRLRGLTVDAGGKGVNVSKMIAALGGSSIATGFLGGGSGGEISSALDGLGIRHDFIRTAAHTRTNLKVLDADGGLTELNEPGPEISPRELDALRETLRRYAATEALFVFSGSLPRGLDPGIYGELIGMVRRAGARAFLDADGKAFAEALAEKPDFVKPNRFELLRCFGVSDADVSDADYLRMCRELLGRGVGRVALSMGERGAMFVTGDEAFFAPGLPVEGHSSVGAGDSMVGAIAHAAVTGLPWRRAAALAMACSAGAVTTIGTKPPSRQTVDSLLPRVEFVEL